MSRSIFLQFVVNLHLNQDNEGFSAPYATGMLNLDLSSLCLALSASADKTLLASANKALSSAVSFQPLMSHERLTEELIEPIIERLKPLLSAFQDLLSHELSTRGWGFYSARDSACRALLFEHIQGFGAFKMQSVYPLGITVASADQALDAAALLSGSLESAADALGAHERVIVCLQRGQLSADEFTPYFEGYRSIDDRLFADLLRLREIQALEALLPPAPRSVAPRSL